MSYMNHQRQMAVLAICGVLATGTAGAYNSLSARVTSPHETVELQLQVAPGYAIRKVADQFSAPVGVSVSDRGDLYVAEAGRSEGTLPRVVKLGAGNNRTTVASDFPAPLTGLTWHDGRLYVAYAGGVDVLDPATGNHHPILAKLPARGDYANGAVVFGPDGKLYFGIGSATNSGVVGQDNLKSGWVARYPEFRDIPCKDVKVKGNNFTVTNPLTKDPQDMATTGAFSAFGSTTARNQVITGAVPCTGSILRANPDGTDLQLVAWGLRQPAGLHFGPDSELYFTMQGFEDRGSRPIVGDRDYFYRAVSGQWYGWPDFAGNRSVTNEQFQKPSLPVTPLLAARPAQPPQPITSFAHGSGAAGLLFPPESFGLGGDALAALSGPGQPQESPAGHMVVRINPGTGTVAPFIKNGAPGPASARDLPGLERPVALAASPRGTVYLLDAGQSRPGPGGLESVPGTGVLWRIEWTARK